MIDIKLDFEPGDKVYAVVISDISPYPYISTEKYPRAKIIKTGYGKLKYGLKENQNIVTEVSVELSMNSKPYIQYMVEGYYYSSENLYTSEEEAQAYVDKVNKEWGR